MNKTSEITVSERLGQFLKQMNMNAFSLSKKIGGTSQKYYKILSGQSNPQYETIQSILDAFPELSAEWLMRGKGDMFVHSQNQETVLELQEKIKEQNNIIVGLKYLAKDSLGKPKGVTSLPENVNLFRPSNPMYQVMQRGLKMAV